MLDGDEDLRGRSTMLKHFSHFIHFLVFISAILL